MEVVGAVSSIITVIQITAKVISTCYEYQRSTHRYPKDIVKITQELQSLRNVLERLADIANSQTESASVSLPTLESLNYSGGPLEICAVEIQQLGANLTPVDGRLKRTGRMLTWPLKEKDVQKTLGILARQRGIFQLALTADHITLTLAVKNATSRTEGSLAALSDRFQAVAMDQRNEQISQWLAAPDVSSNHNKACQTKQRETGLWLLDSSTYINWKNQRASFLWLHGIPGCGKTVLCSTIIDDIASTCGTNGGSILAYYYFDFNEMKKQTCKGLTRSLVAQLYSQCLDIPETIEALFMQCGEGQREPTSKGLAQTLKRLTKEFTEVYFIMDALDECIEIPAVISLIDEICGWHNRNLHILVTSRKETVIERGLRLLITHEIPIPEIYVDGDIKLLVRECLRSDSELSQWSEDIKAEVERALSDGSKGM